jgi:transcriptional regulator with XRE-family HTH domain
MSEWRDRLINRMEELGLTQAEVCRRAGVKSTMLTDILKRGQTPSVANLFKIANAVNLSLSELYEGVVRSSAYNVRVTGILEGATVLDAARSGKDTEISVSLPRDNLETIRIRSDLLEPAGYRRGDTVMGIRVDAQRAGNLIGKDCIVELADGHRLIAQLAKSAHVNRYNLRFFHRSQPDMEDVEIAWVAPISMILRD